VLVVTHQVGRVLVEEATTVHRHHLHAAADAEHRQPAGLRSREQRPLPGVPVGSPRCGALVGLGAVRRRVDVGPAADHQAVQTGDHDIGGPGLVHGRQQDRDPTGAGDRLGVLGRQQVGALVPHPVCRPLPVRREADDGRSHQIGVT
jgi:hypothetical protein